MTLQQFSYSQNEKYPNFKDGLPFLPIVLTGKKSVTVSALVDSGSTINVLPYDIGIRLGLVWEDQKFYIPELKGFLRNTEAFGILLKGTINSFPPVSLAFAWTQSNEVPVILGQTNFFSEFDVCFFGSQKIFTLLPTLKTKSRPA